MMTHRQPLTSSSPAGWDRRLRERASAEGFFASTEKKKARVARSANRVSRSIMMVEAWVIFYLPSSLIEKDLTEMWMTVGISEDVVSGRLLAIVLPFSQLLSPFPTAPYE